MEKRIIKIGLIDDHALVNDALAKILGAFEDFQVVLQATNGNDLMRQLSSDSLPDVVLLDINMPEMDGYQTAKWLKDNHPGIYVLVLTMVDSDLSTVLLIQNGVRGVLKKKMHISDLRRAVHETVDTGYCFQNRRLVALLQPVSDRIVLANNVLLSPNEILFLKLACCELTYKEIARNMELSARTIENYRDSLFQKLNIISRTGLVRYAIKNGLVSSEAYDNP